MSEKREQKVERMTNSEFANKLGICSVFYLDLGGISNISAPLPSLLHIAH